MIKFKIEHISDNRAWSLCPYHDDTVRPNLSISLDKEYYGRFKCWACGKEGNLTDKQMEELNLSKKKKRLKPISINWERLTQEYALYSDKWRELQELWDVRNTALLQFRCGWDGEAYTFPMYNIVGSGLCTTGIQRVWLDGKNKRAVYGSQLGLFMPNCLDDNTIFIVEGISDAVAVYDLGFDVIGKPCATYGDKIIQHFLLESDIHSVIVIPDNDEVGIKSAVNTIKALRRIVSCNMFEFDGAKDIREHISKTSKDQVTKELGQYIQ